MERWVIAVTVGAGAFILGYWVKKCANVVDEERPTIRVRNGSILVELDYGDFSPRGGSKKKWKVSGEGKKAFTVRVPGYAAVEAGTVTLHFARGLEEHDLTVSNHNGVAHLEFPADADYSANIKLKKQLQAGTDLKMVGFTVSSLGRKPIPSTYPVVEID